VNTSMICRRLLLAPSLALAIVQVGAPGLQAQLSDLQAGRNFPTAVDAFGLGRGEEVDVGDVDHDGDYDAVTAYGGGESEQLNQIFINQGGAQGGTPGTFVDETAIRFQGMPADRSRDIDLVDFDGDCDLDLFVTNSGSVLNMAPSRSYLNQGGQQLGAIGHYRESTNDFWGALISVPPAEQLFGANSGPFVSWACDCDFGDLDLDGDLDLFHGSYGPNINGTRDSRIFLNSGAGRFDELWPWADAAADTRMHILDLDLTDLDGDFDLDVFVASRDSQSRVFRNDLDVAAGTWGAVPFTDLTQSALIDTGATLSGSNTYEVEPGDVDGDGDFDLWIVNYDGNKDTILVNQGDFTFLDQPGLIKGDPNQDEAESDFFDYDGDGDLDVFLANFSGTNRIFVSGLAQGLSHAQGLYHRTGTISGGSLAPWDETPTTGNGGTTLDGECADMDGDGDPDLLLINENAGTGKYWENALGVPDTHAPTVHLLTVQGDKADGSDTLIRAQLRDNAPFYLFAFYDVDLVWSVDGGLEARVPMGHQGGQQFQAVIPGGVDGLVSYRVEGADDAGNAFVSGSVTYDQSSSGVVLLQPVGEGTPGVAGRPDLELRGAFAGGSDVDLVLCDAAPSALCLLLFSISSTPLPFKGGLLHTVPVESEVFLTTDAGGQLWLDATWPGGIPTGAQLWQQVAIADASATGGASLSNAVLLTTP
jgi:hypothetical protein